MRLSPTTAIPTAVSAAMVLASDTLSAQQLVEVTGRDRHIDADFEEVYRVGVIAGETWEMFATVQRVAFDAAGNLYLFDRAGRRSGGEARIVVFDSTGAFLREFGSPGEGPGEFKRARDMATMHDGTTVVMDNGHDAYQIFDPSGIFVRMVRMPDEDGGLTIVSDYGFLPDPRGGGVFRSGHGGTSGDGAAGDESGTGSRPITRLGLASEVVNTDTAALGWLPPRGGEGIQASAEIQGGTLNLGELFAGALLPGVYEPAVLMGVLPEGALVYSDSSAYALKITAPDSPEVRRVITRPFRPEPVTESMKREYRERRSNRTSTDTTTATTGEGSARAHGRFVPDARAHLLSRNPRHPPPLRDMGGTHLGAAPGRRAGERRPHRRADRRRRVPRDLPDRRHADAGRLRPGRPGGVRRAGRVRCGAGGRAEAAGGDSLRGTRPERDRLWIPA